MRRALMISLSIGLLHASAAGCAAVGKPVGEHRSVAGERQDDLEGMTGEAGFCLSLTRAAVAIESGSPATAEEAIEEAVALAPEDLVNAARAIADVVRRARDDDGWDPTDPELARAVDQLTATAHHTCESR